MAYRYTNTDKWRDGWYSSLDTIQKLLFNYLCDNCDVAGFIEITPRIWAAEIGCTENQVLGALKGLGRGLMFSKDNDCLYIRNFLKHQKNLPLNENNNAHLGIIRRFENYSYKFNIENIDEFLLRCNEGACEGLSSPIGNGKGKGSGKGKDYIDQIIEIFAEKYKEVFDLEYVITNKGKERSAAGKLADIYRKKYPEANTEESIESFRVYFDACCKIQDDFYRDKISLPLILSQFNQINKILKHGSKKTIKSVADRSSEIDAIVDAVYDSKK
jgi:hypothetical protein